MGIITDKLAEDYDKTDDHGTVDAQEDQNAVKSFDDLEEEMGDKTHRLEFNDIDDLTVDLDEEGNLPTPQPQLDMNEIAEVAHDAVFGYNVMMFPEKVHQRYCDLNEQDRAHLKQEVHEIMQTASNPDDTAVARLKHSQRAMSLLADGYIFSKDEDDANKKTPLVMPWEYLPNEYRMPVILFRNIAKTLVMSVWNGL